MRTKRFTPKFGMRWQARKNLEVRLAAFKNVARPFAADSTIEPTQIAGFNQFFDDASGFTQERHGIGLDYSFSEKLFIGTEFSRRKVDVPIVRTDLLGQFVDFTLQHEKLASAYLHWTPSTQWSLSIEIEHEEFDRDSTFGFPDIEKLETTLLPITARYFHPSGLFGTLKGSFVDQEVKARSESRHNGSFMTVDLAAGYKFPKRSGKVSLEVNNLTDRHFTFQDDSFRIPLTQRIFNPRFLPERTFSVQVSMEF